MENGSEKGNASYSFTFKKEERLCSKKWFDRLFAEGNSFLVYPLKVVFIETNEKDRYPVKAAFSVSKKLFRRAVIRNKLKRRIRESYRLNKLEFYNHLGDKNIAVIFIYVGKEILSYRKIEMAMLKALNKILERLLKVRNKNPEAS